MSVSINVIDISCIALLLNLINISFHITPNSLNNGLKKSKGYYHANHKILKLFNLLWGALILSLQYLCLQYALG